MSELDLSSIELFPSLPASNAPKGAAGNAGKPVAAWKPSTNNLPKVPTTTERFEIPFESQVIGYIQTDPPLLGQAAVGKADHNQSNLQGCDATIQDSN